MTFRPPLRISRLAAVALLSLSVFSTVLPAHALIRMDTKAIDSALVYGMRHGKAGLVDLLGPNWVEGENGALLNVYSPFMMLASKAAKTGYSNDPNAADLEKARKRFAREVSFYSDTKNKFQVKFAVSLYGDSPDFAKNYHAHLVGIGRGQDFDLKPDKAIPDVIADPINGGQGAGSYEAVNSYYFKFADIENISEYQLVLESPQQPTVRFSLRNETLY